jgi:hypothetical protein
LFDELGIAGRLPGNEDGHRFGIFHLG